MKGNLMTWHTRALAVALALVPPLVAALLDGRVTQLERERLLGVLAEQLLALASKPSE